MDGGDGYCQRLRTMRLVCEVLLGRQTHGTGRKCQCSGRLGVTVAWLGKRIKFCEEIGLCSFVFGSLSLIDLFVAYNAIDDSEDSTQIWTPQK